VVRWTLSTLAASATGEVHLNLTLDNVSTQSMESEKKRGRLTVCMAIVIPANEVFPPGKIRDAAVA
jgi:hypothetical protein